MADCTDYPTASTAKRFKNNADSTNEFVTSTADTFIDQDGNPHLTMTGIAKSGSYSAPIPYASGIIFSETDLYKTVEEDSIVYAVLPSELPFITTGVFANDADKFYVVQGLVSGGVGDVSNMSVLATGSTTPRALGDRFSDVVNVKDFENLVVSADWTIAIQTALDTLRPVYIPAGTYLVTDTLTVKNSLYGDDVGTNLVFESETPIVRLISKEASGDIRNISIDGAAVIDATYGIFTDLSFYSPVHEVYSGIIVSNLTSTINASNGILIYRASSSAEISGSLTIQNCKIENISGSSVAKGIMVSCNNDSPVMSVTIKDNVVDTVTPAYDGDAIHVTNGTYDNSDPAVSIGQAVISGNTIRSSLPMKRGIKVQWKNCKVTNNHVFGDNITIGYDTYSYGTVFDGNSYTGSGGEVFNAHGSDMVYISNSSIVFNGSAQVIRLQDSTNCNLSNITIEYNGTASTPELGMIFLEQISNPSTVFATNINIYGTTQQASGFVIKGASRLYLSNSTVHDCAYGIYNQYSSGFCKVDNCDFFGVSTGLWGLGDNGFTFDVRDTCISADNIGVYTDYSGSDSYVYLNNCRISAGSNGVLVGSPDEIKGCSITKSGEVGGQGVGISDNTVVSNNIITGFATGIFYSSSSENTVVYGNTMIGCTTPVTKSSSVDFVYYENNSR